MVDLNIQHLMKEARAAGFTIELEETEDEYVLSVIGPTSEDRILKAITANRDEIIRALLKPSTAIQHYRDRLIHGLEYIRDCETRLEAQPDNKDLSNWIGKAVHMWADIDEELRRIFVEFRGCPIDGCKEEETVRCLHCAPPASKGVKP